MIKIWVIKSGVKTVFLAFQGCFLTMSSRGLSPVPQSSPPLAHVHVTGGFGSAWDSVQPAEIPFPFHLQSW